MCLRGLRFKKHIIFHILYIIVDRRNDKQALLYTAQNSRLNSQ